MKAKELIDILNKMNPETELSLYCGGEDCYEDHPLANIEYHDSETGMIVFKLDDKYKVAKEVDMEDFVNALDCLDFDWVALSYDEQKELLDIFQTALANDDTYNACYNEDLQELLEGKYPDFCNWIN